MQVQMGIRVEVRALSARILQLWTYDRTEGPNEARRVVVGVMREVQRVVRVESDDGLVRFL